MRGQGPERGSESLHLTPQGVVDLDTPRDSTPQLLIFMGDNLLCLEKQKVTLGFKTGTFTRQFYDSRPFPSFHYIVFLFCFILIEELKLAPKGPPTEFLGLFFFV